MFRSLRFTKSDVTHSILLGFLKRFRGQSFKSVFFQPANFGDRNSTIKEVISTCLMIRPLYFTKSDGTHSILLGFFKKLRSQSSESVFCQPEKFENRNPRINKVISTFPMFRPRHFTKSNGTHSILLGLKKKLQGFHPEIKLFNFMQ